MKTYRVTIEITTEEGHPGDWICDSMTYNINPTSEAWDCNVEEVALNADHARQIAASDEYLREVAHDPA
jgi:hypothetical protein